MAMLSGFGGGFFFAPFKQIFTVGLFTAIPGAGAGVFGAWAHPAPFNPLSSPARWVNLTIWPVDYGSFYTVEFGLGAVGSETVFAPTDGNGFNFDWGRVSTAALFPIPLNFSFPFSFPVGQPFSMRCKTLAGGGFALNADLTFFN